MPSLPLHGSWDSLQLNGIYHFLERRKVHVLLRRVPVQRYPYHFIVLNDEVGPAVVVPHERILHLVRGLAVKSCLSGSARFVILLVLLPNFFDGQLLRSEHVDVDTAITTVGCA